MRPVIAGTGENDDDAGERGSPAPEPGRGSPAPEPGPTPRRMDYRIVLTSGNEISLRNAECEYDPVMSHVLFRLADSDCVYRFHWRHVLYYVARVR